MTDRNLTRIAALLRKAEGTNNEHEADAYMQAAQRLATLDSVDLAVARAHTARGEKRAAPVQRTITIGDQGKRGLRRYVRLMLAIGRANDITCDIAHDSTRVYAYGFEADIDAAEALYASLVVQMVRASDQYLKSEERRSETVARYNRRTGMWEDQVVHGTVARNNFMEGFTARIGQRLTESRDDAQAEAARTAARTDPATEDVAVETVSVELVLRNKEIEVQDFYKTRSNAKGSWRGFRSTSKRFTAAQRAGDRAGRNARLGGDKALGGARTALSS